MAKSGERMDRVDLALIRVLEKDARISFTELADRLGLSKTPVWKRVKALEAEGVITDYIARLDPKELGFGLEAFIAVTIDFKAAEEFEAAVLAHPSVWRCHAMTGDADYSLHVLARDMEDMDRLIRREIARLPGVDRTKSSVITRAVKRGQSLAELAERR